MESFFSSREMEPFAASTTLDTRYTPPGLKKREIAFSDRKDERERHGSMLLTYDSNSYAGDPYGEKMDINGIVEKAVEEITRMKERRSAAGG